MPELTINTIIRTIIIILVIAVIVFSFFLLWKNYLKPYFEGLGKGIVGAAGIALIIAKKKVLKISNHLNI